MHYATPSIVKCNMIHTIFCTCIKNKLCCKRRDREVLPFLLSLLMYYEKRLVQDATNLNKRFQKLKSEKDIAKIYFYVITCK